MDSRRRRSYIQCRLDCSGISPPWQCGRLHPGLIRNTCQWPACIHVFLGRLPEDTHNLNAINIRSTLAHPPANASPRLDMNGSNNPPVQMCLLLQAAHSDRPR